MLFAPHYSSIVMTWLTSLPLAMQPRSSVNHSPCASDTYSSTHLISLDVLILKRIGDTGEPCRTPASAGCLTMALPMIIMSTYQSERMLSVHHIKSSSISLTFIRLNSFPFATLGKADLMSTRGTHASELLVAQ